MQCKNCGRKIEYKDGYWLDLTYPYPKLCGTNTKEFHEPEETYTEFQEALNKGILILDPTYTQDEEGNLQISEISICVSRGPG